MAAAQVVHRARQHAAYVAARVAIVLGALGLGRQRSANGSLSASRVLAMAVLPLAAVVVIQTSSSPSPGTGPPLPGQSAIQPRGAGATTTAATGSAHDPAAPTSAGGGVLPATSIAPTATIPPEASSAVHSLTDQVRHAIGGLPGLPTSPLPSPSHRNRSGSHPKGGIRTRPMRCWSKPWSTNRQPIAAGSPGTR